MVPPDAYITCIYLCFLLFCESEIHDVLTHILFYSNRICHFLQVYALTDRRDCLPAVISKDRTAAQMKLQKQCQQQHCRQKACKKRTPVLWKFFCFF